ncbi:MAG: hypothetical protein KA956_03235 [Pyrinomonadaceae bacterium]|nr:hypothetical protein [Pyrinomonadaceae bacterium]MBP7476182.1 hypothetical protein [Pyrinomonadaceae bacterium]
MERDWIVFDEPPRIRKDRIYMMLNMRCELMINRIAFEALGQPESVFLSYSEKTDAIAIEKADARLNNAFPLRLKNSSGNYSVHIKPMCDRHEIKYDSSVRFLDLAIEGDKLVANLLKTSQIPKRKRGQAVRKS